MKKSLRNFTATLRRITVLAALLAAPVQAAAGELDAMREAALNRPRRIIINDDGCDMTEFPRDLPLTMENIYHQMLDKLKETEVDTVSFCPFGVGHVLATRSMVTAIHTKPSTLKTSRNLTLELFSLGTDPLEVAIAFCRANDLEVFVNMRVNDTHDQWHPWISEYKKSHPEELFGTSANRPLYGAWTAFDFALPVVRQRFRAIIAELINNYDVDGVELDFHRHPIWFKSVADGGSAAPEEMEMFTEMMRGIRADADEVSRKRNKYILIAARLPDSLELGRDLGLDIETWMKERLFDIYIPGGDMGRFSRYSESAALAHRYGLKSYPSVDTSWLRAKGAFSRNDVKSLHAQSAAALSGGSDGVYYFNMFYVPTYLRQIRRDEKALAGISRRYFANYHNLYPFSRRMYEFDRLRDCRGIGMVAAATGEPATMLIETADESGKNSPSGAPEIELLIHTVNTPAGVLPRAVLNGEQLPPPVTSGDDFSFRIAPQLLKKGDNIFEFSISSEDAAKIRPLLILDKEQSPGAGWHRLYPGNFRKQNEAIVDHALRLGSPDPAAGCVNLLYALPNLRNGELKVQFDLRVEEAPDPDSVVLRLAVGDFVEQIGFQPDKFTLKFIGKTFPVALTPGFHHYEVETSGDQLKLSADGREIFSETMTMKTFDPRGALTGNCKSIPFMSDRSLLIGSLSGAGNGASSWRDLTLTYPGILIEDAVLNVNYAHPVSAELAAAARLPQPETICADASGGHESFEIFNCTYDKKFLDFSDGTLKMDNNDPRHPFANFNIESPLFTANEPGILSVEWVMEPGAPQSHTDQYFQLVVQPEAGEGMVYDGSFKYSFRSLESPLGICEIPDSGTLVFRVLIDKQNGNAVLFINGREAAAGTLLRNKGVPRLFFGDGSNKINGRAILKSIKAGVIPQP